MTWPLLFIAVLIVAFTFLGGLLALRFQDRLHLILGYSAGAVLGLAFFDLLPEALELGGLYYPITTTTALIALGFLLILSLNNWLSWCPHSGEEEKECQNLHHHGRIGAGSLSLHSFFDGLVVGLSFQVSAGVGLSVTLAVLAHDFSDGINTVSLILRHRGSRKQAFSWLSLDSFAPVLGIAATMFFSVPERYLALIMAIFCGFFLYIGASDLLPESHHRHPAFLATLMTALGMLTLFGVTRLGIG